MLLGLILFGCCSLYITVRLFSTIDSNILALSLTIEDIIVASLSGLSLILITFKKLKIVPTLTSIGTVTTAFVIVTAVLILIKEKLSKNQFRLSQLNLLNFKQPSLKNFYLSLCIFCFYILRALFKAKDFSEIVYIPSRYNTDIFLYLRRISVFLSNNVAINHQYDSVPAINILYDSPKLLSSLSYAIFTAIFNHLGIGGTVLTSLILTAIVVKYILLIQNIYFNFRLLYISIVIYLFFQPALSWLQDQFYLSNLLYLYLLIYAVEDLILEQGENKIILKFGLSAIAILGFYPSQLPFLTLASIILVALDKQQLSSKIPNIIRISAITILSSLIFLPQYLATTEVRQHFNLTDSQHGINFVYIPFWSILNLVPRPGGFKVSFGSIALVILSIMMTLLTTKYLAKNFQTIAKYLYLSAFLYIIYSLSFLIFPGSYRQGKFWVTYIIPLVIFCFLKIITSTKHKNILTAIVILLTLYVGFNSLDRKYKSHLSQDIQSTIEHLQEQKQVIIYHESTDYRFYYLNVQLKKLPLDMVSHCPSKEELAKNTKPDSTIVISDVCDRVNLKDRQTQIIKLD